ncbi:toxin-antitoxin system YwqK family antitoxin [Sulfurospirillum deleyianum]|uniref:MORN variant repeat protein n=1 Tax=Sulfurospirillum deleyianum (strain ATCC 51133 / DSM 6946 / 5175) TaxID=525898 RepID=D1B0Z6_SULD5|nr:toxin-antitoxin system YwqK family antitoxin [Sulfurospirillum deleyianum]ACZ11766.1 MORN variant repeat protein [Sulfurospirillum deleyianum DSM 6946]
MKWILSLLCSALMLFASERYYGVEDLDVREDGTLLETQTKKPANGVGQFFYESGQVKSQTPFKNGLREGLGKTYYESGHLRSETPFVNDKIEGLKKEYYESGVVQTEIQFKNDEANGLAKFYYPTGALQGETPFSNNKANGVAKLYSPSGKLMRTIEFKEGEVVKGLDYDAKGNQKELSREALSEATR